jgi:threonine synthase
VVTLLEGATPLVQAQRLSQRVDAEVWLKVEGANPTGSFKDRGMTMAISKAVEAGSQAVICASTGNTSASAAAYAAKGGLTCAVLVPEGKIALGKLAQAWSTGPSCSRCRATSTTASTCAGRCRGLPTTLVNSVNPTGSRAEDRGLEICDALGDAPDSTACRSATPATSRPTGRATRSTPPTASPRCARDAGLPGGGGRADRHGARVPAPQTIATAIRIGNPASWQQALDARDESRRRHPVRHRPPDPVRLPAAAQKEGVFVEPASAASVAGLLQAHEQGLVPAGARVVCTVTATASRTPTGRSPALPSRSPSRTARRLPRRRLGLA